MKRSASRQPCKRVERLAIAFGLLAAFAGAAARLEGKRRHSRPESGVAAKVHQLILKAYGLSLRDAKPTTDKIQNLVIHDLDVWIQNRTPSFVEVRRKLEREFGTLRYPFYVECSAFAAPWKGQQIIGAGYSLGWGKYDRVNVVAIYVNSKGHTRRIALTHFVPRTNLNYIVAPPDAMGDFRFFIWGTRRGKAQPRLTAILYSTNGQALKPLWEKKDVYDGKIALENYRVILTYVNESSYISAVQQNRLPPRHQVTYELLSEGLKFESERNVPF